MWMLILTGSGGFAEFIGNFETKELAQGAARERYPDTWLLWSGGETHLSATLNARGTGILVRTELPTFHIFHIKADNA